MLCKWDIEGNLVWSKKVNKDSKEYVFLTIFANKEKDENYIYTLGYRTNEEKNVSEGIIAKWNNEGDNLWLLAIPDCECMLSMDIVDNGYIYLLGYDENKNPILTKIHAEGKLTSNLL